MVITSEPASLLGKKDLTYGTTNKKTTQEKPVSVFVGVYSDKYIHIYIYIYIYILFLSRWPTNYMWFALRHSIKLGWNGAILGKIKIKQ